MTPELGFFKGLTYFGISLEFWLRFGEIFTILLLLIGGLLSLIKKFFSTPEEKIKNDWQYSKPSDASWKMGE